MRKPKVRVKKIRGREKETPAEGKKRRAKKKDDAEDDLPAPEVRFSKDK
jgi:hypothetical protein